MSPPPDSRFPFLKLLYCESSHYWFLPFGVVRGSFKRRTKKAGVSLCSKEEVKGLGETIFFKMTVVLPSNYLFVNVKRTFCIPWI